MSRFIFAALGSIILANPAASQQVPARDLFEFPIGLLAEPAALSSQMAGGFWNPAAADIRTPARAAFSVAELYSPQEQGVRLAMAGAAYALHPRLTLAATISSAWVNDLLRTETDPQSLGGEIPYRSTLFSVGVATHRDDVSFGLAARYRTGISDDQHGSSLGVDGGIVVDRIGVVPVRLAASTFLFKPAPSHGDASYELAADAPLILRDSTLAVRAGYSLSFNGDRGREGYTFAAGSYRQLELSGGVARNMAFGLHDLRWRLGFAIHYAGYTVALGREDGAAGLGASYQFLFKRVIQ